VHEEAIKFIEDLKRRPHDLQVSERNNRTAAKTTQAKFSTLESGWSQERQALDREIADVTFRCSSS
jgi:nucleoprotein TPR